MPGPRPSEPGTGGVRRLRSALAATTIALVALAAPGPEVAAATPPAVALRFLNLQRASFGIPSLSLDQRLLKPSCTLSNHEIASPFHAWSRHRSPWSNAPLHENDLYSPFNTDGSYHEYQGFSSDDPTFPDDEGLWACMWFHRGYGESDAAPSFYWASEADGPAAVPPSLSAVEWPATPAQMLGLKNPTGPNLFAYATQMDYGARVLSASVSSAGHSIPTRYLDSTTSWRGQHYLGAGNAILVVTRPVRPQARFEATVVWERERDGAVFTQEFPFHTGGSRSLTSGSGETLLVHPRLRLASLGQEHGRARVRVRGGSALLGRRAHLSFRFMRHACSGVRRCGWRSLGPSSHATMKIYPSTVFTIESPPPGRGLKITARSDPFHARGHRFAAAAARLLLR
jgi:hypothetical protein